MKDSLSCESLISFVIFKKHILTLLFVAFLDAFICYSPLALSC